MGIYLNPGSDNFQMARSSEIYVDKSGLIAYLNSVINTEDRFVCVSRPRRFGKSMAANMIAAYYDRTVDNAQVFQGLEICEAESYDKQGSQYDVIQINMQDFLTASETFAEFLGELERAVLWDLLEEYPDFRYYDRENLSRTMADIYRQTRRRFVVVIDEWDCVFREYKERKDWQEKYLDFLRGCLKDKRYVALAYMTGILPIKKYGTHSALNMFTEFSMTGPGPLAAFAGFTEKEVASLCRKYGMDFEECKNWYDGYHFAKAGAVYNPRSVILAMKFRKFDAYWNRTETFEALKIYIDMNYDGLREAIIALMAGERRAIDTGNFSNDMTTFHAMDDVLTLLVHLGYLGYDAAAGEVYIPNKEIAQEFVNATRTGGWEEVARALKMSGELLQATWDMDAARVAEGIEVAHLETSHLQYNDENALSYTLSLAYYTARQKYAVVREFPTGKGFADLVFLPRRQYDVPAMIVELKWNLTAKTALGQIRAKDYPQALKDYAGKILLVGIAYDKNTRKHSCEIEEMMV